MSRLLTITDIAPPLSPPLEKVCSPSIFWAHCDIHSHNSDACSARSVESLYKSEIVTYRRSGLARLRLNIARAMGRGEGVQARRCALF